MTELFKEVVILPFPMTYKQIETALQKSSPEQFIWRLPEDDGGQVLGSQSPYTTFGTEFFAEEGGIRLLEGSTYTKIFVVSNEGFGGVVHAVYDSPDEEVIIYCKKVVQDFLAACQ